MNTEKMVHGSRETIFRCCYWNLMVNFRTLHIDELLTRHAITLCGRQPGKIEKKNRQKSINFHTEVHFSVTN